MYALAIAASVLLSFYPFLTVMLSLCRNVLHWPAAVQAIYVALDDYFPGDLAVFLRNNAPRAKFQVGSMFLLLLTANGVFEPLEVALNRAWGVAKNRPYWKNQLVALGMIFACGSLALLSLIVSALKRRGSISGRRMPARRCGSTCWSSKSPRYRFRSSRCFWSIGCCRTEKSTRAARAAAAILTGIVLEALKYLSLLAWGFMQAKIRAEYGVFQHSATILLWSFMSAMIVLAGADWSARRSQRERPIAHPTPL